MINGIPFKPGVSPILDAIGRVQSETKKHYEDLYVMLYIPPNLD